MKTQSPTDQIEAAESRQLIITFSGPENEIIRVEIFDESGKLHDVSSAEFAALMGDYDAEEFFSALEQVYSSSLYGEDCDFELEDSAFQFDDDFEPVAVRRVTGHRLIGQEARKLVLSRLVWRAFLIARLRDQCSAELEDILVASRRFYN
jgi:hypothetical protein